MANGFSKEEIVMFNQSVELLDNYLVFSKLISDINEKPEIMERANDTIWFPIQYLMTSYSGVDMTSNFKDVTQLSVPITLNTQKSVPFKMTAKNQRDPLQVKKMVKAGIQRLANDIDTSIYTHVKYNSGVTIKSTSAMQGFQDVAAVDTKLNSLGFTVGARRMLLSSVDYNAAAQELAERSTVTGIVEEAYKKAYIKNIAGIDLYKQNSLVSLAASGASSVTVNGAGQSLIPKATSTAATGETSNYNNNFMNLTVSVGGGALAAGDRFTIANVFALNLVNYENTAALQTFTVAEVVSPTVMKITPAIIVNDGINPSTAQYANCSAAPANGAAITLLNTATKPINPFFVEDAIKLVVGRYDLDDSGWISIEEESANGVPVRFSKANDVNTFEQKYRLDILFQPSILLPQGVGVSLFNQV
jgi:hypothetical protein